MKKFYSLFLAIFIAVFSATTVKAADYTIFHDADVLSYALPIAYSNETSHVGAITQQIYWAEELTSQGATAGDINSITFYYTADAGKTASAYSRNIQVYLMEVDNTVDVYSISKPSSDWVSKFLYDNSTKKAGVKVYEGLLSTAEVTSSSPINYTTDIKTVTIPITAFSWDGTKNIVMTVADVSNSTASSVNLRFLIASTKISTTSYPRFAYTKWNAVNDSRLDWINDFSGEKWSDKYGYTTTTNNTEIGQKSQRSYVNKVTFSISTTIPAPENLDADDEYITTSSARLSWDAVDDATSYNVRWGTTSGSLSESEEGVTNTYLDIDELEDGTTYYFDVQTVTADGTSAFADEVSFETLGITHEHNGITFSKWNSTTSMPTSGNYYLANDVELSANTSLTGNLNLCLNGHKINTYVYNIVVPEEKKLAIYDNEGGGQIYGYYVGNNGSYYGLISVVGELVLSEGIVRNLSEPQNSGDISYAIYNNGTFKLSGAPTITGNTAAIHLNSNKYITIESGKPLTNSTPYTVNSFGQVITSGWANMSGANPANFFTSAKSGYPAVILDGGEAKLVNAISLSQDDSEETFNNKISGKTNIVITVSLDRSFTSASYNTVCLPFGLTNEQLEYVFGSGYDLQAFQDADLDGETLLLSFSQVTSLTAGVPYLIQPSIDVVNPTFNGVTIPSEHSPAAQTSAYIDFQGVYSPTDVGSGKNILFVGANNELFWNNNASGELKGFRAFFTAKGAAAQAIRARIVKKDNAATAIDNVQGDDIQCKKVLQNGQLLIQHNGTMYNVQGQMVK